MKKGEVFIVELYNEDDDEPNDTYLFIALKDFSEPDILDELVLLKPYLQNKYGGSQEEYCEYLEKNKLATKISLPSITVKWGLDVLQVHKRAFFNDRYNTQFSITALRSWYDWLGFCFHTGLDLIKAEALLEQHGQQKHNKPPSPEMVRSLTNILTKELNGLLNKKYIDRINVELDRLIRVWFKEIT